MLSLTTTTTIKCPRPILYGLSKIGVLSQRRHKVAVDFVNDSRYKLRPTKYSPFDVLENMLSSGGTDLGVGVLVARNPLCVSRNIEKLLPSTEYIKRWATFKPTKVRKPILNADGAVVFQSDDNDDDFESVSHNHNTTLVKSNDNHHTQLHSSVELTSEVSSDDFSAQHYASIRNTIETICLESLNNAKDKPKSNLYRVPHDTTFLFVKSKILFPNEWYIPTLFVSKYMNIHEAANSVKYDVLHLDDDIATIASPFPSVAVTENIPKDHPLYEKLRKKISIFIYRAIYHGHHEEIEYDTDIIQDAQWFTAAEAKDILRPSFYEKLSTIF